MTKVLKASFSFGYTPFSLPFIDLHSEGVGLELPFSVGKTFFHEEFQSYFWQLCRHWDDTGILVYSFFLSYLAIRRVWFTRYLVLLILNILNSQY